MRALTSTTATTNRTLTMTEIPTFVPDVIPKIEKTTDHRSGKKCALTAFSSNKGLERVVDSAFEALVLKRMELFQCDALDALHDLAMMPITKNSAQNNITYLAACRLAGSTTDERGKKGPDLMQTLNALNEKFHGTAQRIKEVRARIVTFEDGR